MTLEETEIIHEPAKNCKHLKHKSVGSWLNKPMVHLYNEYHKAVKKGENNLYVSMWKEVHHVALGERK